MIIREGQNIRVLFDTKEELGDKVDKCSHDRQISCKRYQKGKAIQTPNTPK